VWAKERDLSTEERERERKKDRERNKKGFGILGCEEIRNQRWGLIHWVGSWT